jgi:hypothetical protein
VLRDPPPPPPTHPTPGPGPWRRACSTPWPRRCTTPRCTRGRGAFPSPRPHRPGTPSRYLMMLNDFIAFIKAMINISDEVLSRSPRGRVHRRLRRWGMCRAGGARPRRRSSRPSCRCFPWLERTRTQPSYSPPYNKRIRLSDRGNDGPHGAHPAAWRRRWASCLSRRSRHRRTCRAWRASARRRSCTIR